MLLAAASVNAEPEEGTAPADDFAEKVVEAYADLSPAAKASVNEEAKKLLEEFRTLPPEEQSAVILQLQTVTNLLLKAAAKDETPSSGKAR